MKTAEFRAVREGVAAAREDAGRKETNPLRIVFLAPEEPSVMPVYFGRVLPLLRSETAAVGVVSPIYKKSSWFGQAKRFVDAFGVRDFVVEAAHYGYEKVAGLLSGALPVGRHRSVKALARDNGLRLMTPADVNAPEFLEQLRALRPDLVISVSCPQIFREELLEIPRLGCVNLHSALLPHYRGMLPTFWVLAKGERETGVSMHYMTPGIDGGGIIHQERVAIDSDDTLHSLMRKCKRAAAELTVETVERFRRGPVEAAPNPTEAGSYFSFPTRADVREFRRRARTLR